MSLKPYPLFQEITLEDRELFEKAFAVNPPRISEFTFTNIYAWRQAEKLTAAILDNFIILRAGLNNQEFFFSPIGSGNMRLAIAKILNEHKIPLCRAPKEIIALFKDDAGYEIKPNPDNADYLYEIKSLLSLKGRKYDGKRNLIKKFKNNYSFQYSRLSDGDYDAYLDFEKHWCLLKNCDNVEGLNNERQAIRDMLKNFSAFKLIGACIKIENNISAIAVGQRLNANTLVLHVLKADPRLDGLYQTILNEFLRRETEGFEYMNMEQDMGIEGLRKAKQSYHPIAMVEKYTVTIMPNSKITNAE